MHNVSKLSHLQHVAIYYRAYVIWTLGVVAKLSSIINPHHHLPMAACTLLRHHACTVYHIIHILSPFFLHHPNIFVFIFHLLVYF